MLNSAPVAVDDNFGVDQDSSLYDNVASNDWDADFDPLSFGVQAGPSYGSVSLQSNGNFEYTPYSGYSGADSFTYLAYDGLDYSNEATVFITINAVQPSNNSPQIDSIGDQYNSEGDSINLYVSASDPDNDSLSYSADGLPDGLSIDSMTGLISGTVPDEGIGSYSVTVSVEDGQGGSTSTSFDWEVSNVAPTLTATATIADENGTVTLSGTIDDPGTQDTFTLTVDWGDGIVENFTFAAGTTTFSQDHQYLDDDPTSTPSDQYTINLLLTDDDAGSTAGTAATTISNIAPTADVNVTPSISEDEGVTLSGTISDPGTLDTFVLVVDWGDGSTSTYNYAAGTTSFSETHQYLDDGPSPGNDTPSDDYIIIWTLTDDDGGTASGSVTTTVYNVAPEVSVNQEECNCGSTTLTISVTDPGTLDVLSGTIDWGDGSTESLSFQAGQPITVSHDFAQAGSYTVQVTVSDDDTGTTDVELQVEVEDHDQVGGDPDFTWTTDNQPPTLSVSDRTDAEGSSIDFIVQGTDPENLIITYAALNLPQGISIDPQSGQVSGTIDYTAAEKFDGTYSVTVVAIDQEGGSVTSTFTWTVTDQNRPPQVTAPGNQANAEGDAVSVQVQATDQDGDTLVYQARNLPLGLYLDGLSGQITGTVYSTAAAYGPYTVTIVVTDGKTTTEQSFTWTVIAVNEVPETVQPDDRFSMFDETVQVQIWASDADNDELTYSATGLPDGLTIDPSTGLIEGVISASASASSPYTVVLTVWDGIASANQTFHWSVSPIHAVAPDIQISTEGDSVILAIQASQAVDLPLTYSADSLPDGLTIDPDTGVITGTLAFGSSVGLGQLATVNVTDGIATVNVSFIWNVVRLNNSAPTIANPGSQETALGTAVYLPLSVTDLDGDDLYFSADGLPPGLIIDSTTGVIAGTILSDADVQTPYTASITAEDGHGGIANLILNWFIDPAIIAVQGTSLNVTEGQELAADIASLVAYDGDFAASVDWGDGSAMDEGSIYSLLAGLAVFGRHKYTHPGLYTVTISVTDNLTGQAASGTSSVSVASAGLSSQGGLAFGAIVGQDSMFTLAGFLDPSPNDANTSYQATIDWGDGSGPSSGTALITEQGIVVSGQHIYDSNGTYTVSVTLSDQDGHSATAQAQAHVGDAFAQSELSITVAEFDGVILTATIDWGDGTTSEGVVSGSQVTGTHRYTEVGSYTVQVTVNGDCNSHTVQEDIEVVAAPIGLALTPLWATESEAMPTGSVLGILTSQNTNQSASEFTAQIDWGDGSAMTTAAVDGAAGLFQLLAQHTFAQAGTFTVAVSIFNQANQLVALAFAQANVQNKIDPTPFTKVARGIFKMLDVNSNGILTLAEIENAMKWDGQEL